jgi:hypothetical protein
MYSLSEVVSKMPKSTIFRSSSTKVRLGVVAGAVVFSTLIASAAGASYGTTVGNGIAPGAVVQGQTLVIEGSGYKAGGTLTIIVDNSSKVLGHTHANAVGGFKSNVKIPTTLTPGKHVIEFRGTSRYGLVRIDKLTIVVHR